jgi:hypothetical protein
MPPFPLRLVADEKSGSTARKCLTLEFFDQHVPLPSAPCR